MRIAGKGALFVLVLCLQGEALGDTAELEAQSGPARAAPGVGMSVGQAASVRLFYRLPSLHLSADLGIGVGLPLAEEEGLHLQANLRWEQELGPVTVLLGAGIRRLAHSYAPSSVDELGEDTHQGVHALLGAAWAPTSLPLDLTFELSPGVDLSQTSSCTFLSGTQTLCPHEGEAGSYLGAMVGARYWIEM